MTKTYSCPKCGRSVEPKYINVAKDILLCPFCGEISVFSELVDNMNLAEHDDILRHKLSAPPPKNLQLENDTFGVSGKITLTYRKIPVDTVLFIPFTLVWAGGSLGGIYGQQFYKQEFDWKLTLFGIPFLIASLVMVGTCFFKLFGKRMLTLERGEGTYFCGVGPFGIRRRFTFNRNTKISCIESMSAINNRRNINYFKELILQNENNSDTVHICAGMSEDALEYVEAVLKREAKRT